MRKSKTLLTILLVMFMVTTLAFANGEKEVSNNQVFNTMIKGEPTILDPAQYRDDTASTIIGAIHEPLIRIAGEGGREYEEGLATKFDHNEDFTVWTFYLRKNAKWQDGTPVTAEDVVYSFQRGIDPALGSKKVDDYFMIKNAREIYTSLTEAEDETPIADLPLSNLGVKAVDDYTVQFTLNLPCDFFCDYLKSPGWSPIQKEAGEKFGEMYGTDFDKVVASGPFCLSSWDHNASLTLTKNENYWDEANVALDEVFVSIVQDANTQLSLFDTGMLDFTTISQEVANSDKYPTSQSMELLRVQFIEFNPNEKIDGVAFNFFQNKDIREALSLAFDRQAYASQIMKQPEVAAYSLVPYGMRGEAGGDFAEQQGPLVFDMNNFPGGTFDGKTYSAGKEGAISRAKDLLAKGLKALGKTATDMEKGTVVQCINSPGSITQAEAIQAMWKQNLGLNITVLPLDIGTLLPLLINCTFQCVVGGGRNATTFDPEGMLDFVYTENKWNNPEFRSLYEEMLSNFGDKRLALLKEVEKMVCENFVYIPQVGSITNYVLSDRVEGFRMYPLCIPYDFKHIVLK
ncbi:MAG: peptide ABC transporter substrate-binding protein [Sphaerochaetaceae bacterium]